MEIQTQEARIILAIKTIRSSRKISYRAAAKIYKVPKSIFANRITSRSSRHETKTNSLKLTELEEGVIVRYILDIDTKGFAPRPAGIEDIINYILESREGEHVRTR
jgi:hypothetical protein